VSAFRLRELILGLRAVIAAPLTARAERQTMPPSILADADEVIE
jgi:hypothetical protein